MKLPFSTNDTKLKAQDEVWYFSFYMNETIPEDKKLKFLDTLEEQLSGQLSDGWGESLSQRGMLVENQVIYPGFSQDNMSIQQDMLPSSTKIKMKK